MVVCCVVGCKSKIKTPHIKFHRFPKKRKYIWSKIVNRKDFKPNEGTRICGAHFVSGYPGWDPSDVDWVPTLNLPTNRKPLSQLKVFANQERKNRLDERVKKKEVEYGGFIKELVHDKRLKTSLRFHDYMSTEISMEHDQNGHMVERPLTQPSLTENFPIIYVNDDMHTVKQGGVVVEPIEVGLEEKKLISTASQTDYIDLEVENRNLKNEIKTLKATIKKMTWGAEKIADSDEMTRFYTGLPTFAIFLWLFNYLKPKAEKMSYWRGSKCENEVPPTRKRNFKISLIDQFFAVMVRLKVGLFSQDIADRFNISISTFSDMFATWITLMDLELAQLFPFPTKSLVEKYMPECFKKYPNTRIIIDCTEIFVEKSSSFTTQSLTFSNYKNHNTSKFLVGITPGGVISFVSEAWGGRVSDKVITKESGIILLLEPGDNVMADKGFLIEDMLKDVDCGLNLPPFLTKRAQFTEKEILETRRIAEVRINVERAIGRVKTFHIFDGIMPITMTRQVSRMFAVCCYITNIYEPLT